MGSDFYGSEKLERTSSEESMGIYCYQVIPSFTYFCCHNIFFEELLVNGT